MNGLPSNKFAEQDGFSTGKLIYIDPQMADCPSVDWRVSNKVGRFTPNKMDWYIDIHSGFRNAGCFTWNFLDIYHTNKVRCLKARVTNKVERLRQSNQQSKISPLSHINSPSFAGLCWFTIQYHPVITHGIFSPISWDVTPIAMVIYPK